MTINIKNNGIICMETKEFFKTQRDAAKAKGITQAMVSRSARNIRPTKGLNFRFVDNDGNIVDTPAETRLDSKANDMPNFQLEMKTTDENPIVVIHNESLVTAEQGEHINGNSKAVCCLETGEVYPSATDMAKAHGVSQTYLSKCCRDGSVCNGKHYFYVKSASEKVEDIVTYIRSLQSKVNDPEYLAWKKAKEDAEAEERRKKAEQEAFERRKAELEAKVVKQSEAVKAVSIKLAHEREALEAIITELEQHMAKAN